MELAYHDGGPTMDVIRRALGTAASTLQHASQLAPVAGPAVTELTAKMGKPKGTIPLAGAALSVRPWREEEGGGTLGTTATFTLMTANGRVFGFVADDNDTMVTWMGRLDAGIKDADAKVAAMVASGASLEGAQKTRGSRFGLQAALRASTDAASAAAAAPVLTSLASGGSARSLLHAGSSTMLKASGADAASAASAVLSPAEERLLTSRGELLSGWLFKADSAGKRWGLRFFVLRGNVLSYYTDDTERELKGSLTIGPFTLLQMGPGPDEIAGNPSRPSVSFPTPFHLYLGPPHARDQAYVTGGHPHVISGFAQDTLGSKSALRAYFFSARTRAQQDEWRDMLLRIINAARKLCGLAECPREKVQGGNQFDKVSSRVSADLSSGANSGELRAFGY
jgi:hypothetical protein